MCITAHLTKLNFICHLLAQSASLLMFSCCSITAFGCLALFQSLMSSVNLEILLTMLLSKSLMYMRNSSGPSTLPCGTPDVTDVQSLYIGLVHADPFFSAQLASSWFIWLHHLGCHVYWPLPIVSRVVHCQMLFGSNDRPSQQLYYYLCHRRLWLVQRNQTGLWGSCVFSKSMLGVTYQAVAL